MADVTHRVYTVDVHDGTTGQKVDERKMHALGIEVDGVFVPFLTKEDTYIQRQVEVGKQSQAQEQQTSDSQQTQGSSQSATTQ